MHVVADDVVVVARQGSPGQAYQQRGNDGRE
jgi:hypothetical protein